MVPDAVCMIQTGGLSALRKAVLQLQQSDSDILLADKHNLTPRPLTGRNQLALDWMQDQSSVPELRLDRIYRPPGFGAEMLG